MSKWALIMLLAVQTHVAASYLVPLDKQAQGEFGGLLRWLWPWSYGDGGPLGQVAAGQDLPAIGLFLALTATTFFGLAMLAAAGMGVPSGWCPALAVTGAVLLLCLLASFFGPTKLAPIAIALGTLYLMLGKPALVGAT